MKNLDAELDKWFAIFTRVRFANYDGMVICYTCPTRLHWTQMECGHFMRRGHNTTRWDKANARAQCHPCNAERNGMPEVFEAELRAELGGKKVNAVIAKSKQIDRRTDKQKRKLLMRLVFECKAKGVIA